MESGFMLKYRDAETLERLNAMGVVRYLPALHEQLRFLFANEKLSKAELEAIDGVERVEVPATGTLCSDGINF